MVLASNADAAGVAAIKEQSFHADASANPVVYLKLMEDDSPSIKITTRSRVFTLDRSKLAGKVDVLDSIPTNITKEAELEPLRNSLLQLQDFSRRFPKSVPLLENHLKSLESNIRQFDEGKLRFNGEWMTKDQHAQIADHLKAEMAAYKRSETQRIAEKRQRMEQEELTAKRLQLGMETFEGSQVAGRLGSTKAQCIAKYGPPVKEQRLDPNDPDPYASTHTSSTFNKEEFTVECHFFEDKCVRITYTKITSGRPVAMADVEIDTLLTVNSGGNTWVKSDKSNANSMVWDTEDAKRIGTYIYGKPGTGQTPNLVILLKDDCLRETDIAKAAAEASSKAAKKATEEGILKGF